MYGYAHGGVRGHRSLPGRRRRHLHRRRQLERRDRPVQPRPCARSGPTASRPAWSVSWSAGVIDEPGAQRRATRYDLRAGDLLYLDGVGVCGATTAATYQLYDAAGNPQLGFDIERLPGLGTRGDPRRRSVRPARCRAGPAAPGRTASSSPASAPTVGCRRRPVKPLPARSTSPAPSTAGRSRHRSARPSPSHHSSAVSTASCTTCSRRARTRRRSASPARSAQAPDPFVVTSEGTHTIWVGSNGAASTGPATGAYSLLLTVTPPA